LKDIFQTGRNPELSIGEVISVYDKRIRENDYNENVDRTTKLWNIFPRHLETQIGQGILSVG